MAGFIEKKHNQRTFMNVGSYDLDSLRKLVRKLIIENKELKTLG